jgi:hypothetical protein
MNRTTDGFVLAGPTAPARARSWRPLHSIGLVVSLLLAATVHAEYQRPIPAEGEAPTGADLLLYDGASRTVTVQVLNLTPWNIDFKNEPGKSWSITSADETEMVDRNRNVKKSFMFPPVGVPERIPAAPSQNFETPTIKVNGVEVANPDYDPNYVDTVTHPYPMLFSWDDRAGFVEDSWVKWTVRDIGFWKCDNSDSNSTCEYLYQDVDLGLWMYRNKPTVGLQSGYLTEIVAAVKVVFTTLKIVVDPVNPVAWMNEYLALERLADETREFVEENKKDNDGNKMWVASYPIPHPESTCGATGTNCVPALVLPDELTGDGVYANWTPTFAGPIGDDGKSPDDAAESMLTVSVHVYRGHNAKQCDPAYYPNKCPLGMEPIVMITVMRASDFTIPHLIMGDPVSSGNRVAGQQSRRFMAQAGAVRIRQLLKGRGTYGLDVLRGIVEQLQPTETRMLLGMVRDMHSGRLPTTQERRLVQQIASRLQARLK